MIANDQFRARTAAAREPRHRLVQLKPRNPSTGALRVSNAYPVIPPGGWETGLRGPMGRRVLKVVEEYGGGSWSTNSVTKFVYDLPAAPAAQAGGWNLALELDGLSNDSPIARYTWGLDLSQTIQGAGGIGGLLAVDKIKGTKYAALCVYDGNGNLGQLIDADTGQTLAEYEYDPYGREIHAAGTLAAWNRIRFSTKYHDPETGLVYYGFRFYSPRLGRWMSRDPIEEAGGESLYGFTRNYPVGNVDMLGLMSWGRLLCYSACAVGSASGAVYACPKLCALTGPFVVACVKRCTVAMSAGGVVCAAWCNSMFPAPDDRCAVGDTEWRIEHYEALPYQCECTLHVQILRLYRCVRVGVWPFHRSVWKRTNTTQVVTSTDCGSK